MPYNQCMKFGVSIFLLATVAVNSSASAAQLSGKADVLDGDTIKIAGVTIRLNAIDAPEALQSCNDRQGVPWDCGASSTRALRELVRDQTVVCTLMNRDSYKRLLAECWAGQTHLNDWMVRNGWALAFTKYDKKFLPHQNVAKAKKAGIWRGKFILPWEWRMGIARKTQAHARVSATAPSKCVIKGNISRNGRNYHMPWQQFYNKTQITASRGERWFCTEDEARTAGWRRSLR